MIDNKNYNNQVSFQPFDLWFVISDLILCVFCSIFILFSSFIVSSVFILFSSFLMSPLCSSFWFSFLVSTWCLLFILSSLFYITIPLDSMGQILYSLCVDSQFVSPVFCCYHTVSTPLTPEPKFNLHVLKLSNIHLHCLHTYCHTRPRGKNHPISWPKRAVKSD